MERFPVFSPLARILAIIIMLLSLGGLIVAALSLKTAPQTSEVQLYLVGSVLLSLVGVAAAILIWKGIMAGLTLGLLFLLPQLLEFQLGSFHYVLYTGIRLYFIFAAGSFLFNINYLAGALLLLLIAVSHQVDPDRDPEITR